jgi:hypothetical protein
MPTLEERVETLERRVSEWEGQLGFLIPLTRQLHREILTVREGVQRIDSKLDRLENKVDQGFAKVDQGFALIPQRFVDVDRRFEKIEGALEALPRVLAEEITRRR